jgi:beta-lactamase class A
MLSKKNFLLLVLFFAVILSVGILIGRKTSIFKKIFERSDCENNFTFLNPDIACDLSAEKKLETVKDLEKKINDYIAYSIKEKKVFKSSVFFRDLSSKKWVGIEQNENYAPASLLKLPLLIAYFKLSETESGLLSKKYIFIKPDSIFYQNFEPKVQLQEGKEYTLEEILRHMIIYSDNSAMDFLWQIIDETYTDKIFYELNVASANNTEEDFLSPITYSNIMRILYNSSYLTRNSSEKILQWLSETDFKDGLVAGVPSTIPVAHKFGERDVTATTKELHDCGIIYYPDHPYILCVMTLGDNYDNLKEVISKISETTYEEVKNLNGN